jgi:hypothetical protein
MKAYLILRVGAPKLQQGQVQLRLKIGVSLEFIEITK